MTDPLKPFRSLKGITPLTDVLTQEARFNLMAAQYDSPDCDVINIETLKPKISWETRVEMENVAREQQKGEGN